MRFEVAEPRSLEEAVALLAQTGKRARALAGGTDLLVRLRRRQEKVDLLVSLERVPGFNAITYRPGQGLFLGPMVTHATAAAHPVVRERFTALAQACASVGSPQIRNLATIAGNLANASPAADTAPALLALGAELTLTGPAGQRKVPLEDFFLGPGKTVLAPAELIREIFVPEPPPGTASTYLKLGRRRALEIAICGVALQASFAEGRWRGCRLALGAVAPKPFLAGEASALLDGQEWTEELLEAAGQRAAAASAPIDDQRATADYRREMVAVLTKRAAQELLRQRGR